MPRCCGYVYRFNVKSGKTKDFYDFCKKLDVFSEGLPAGAQFGHVYQTRIGPEPRFEMWFWLDGLAQFDAVAKSAGMQKFHVALEEFTEPGAPHYNLLVEEIA